MSNNQFVIENEILTKYVGQESVVTIPDGVSEIGENAFENNKYITKVFLSDDCRSIGDHAFYCCMNLIHVRLGTHTETIGRSAFFSCKKLKSVTNTVGLKRINEYAFHFDYELVDITLPSISYCSDSAFAGCSEELCREIDTHITEKNARPNKYTCKQCGRPLYSQNEVIINSDLQLCNECAFVDYDSYIALKEQKFRFDSKKNQSSNRKYHIIYIACCAFILFLVALLQVILSDVAGITLGGIPMVILGLIMFGSWAAIRKPLRQRIVYKPKSISDYIADNNVALKTNGASILPTNDKEKYLEKLKKESATETFDNQKSIKHLYECLANNPSVLSSKDIDSLVSDFVARAKLLDTDDTGTYEVKFDLKKDVFNGVLVINNDTKQYSLFKVLNAYNSQIDIELRSNDSAYYYNATIAKKVEPAKSIDETIRTLERLSSLRDSGSISDSEYEALKKGVLK